MRNSKGQFVKGHKSELSGKKLSDITKKKISDALLGRFVGSKHPNYGKHPSIESRKKMSEAQKKNPNRYWLGRKRSERDRRKMSLGQVGKKISDKARRNMSLAQMGREVSLETRKKIGDTQRGKKRPRVSEETRKKLSESNRGKHGGKNSNFWRGGRMKDYPEREQQRKSIEYRLWRESVFARDNWTCQKCKIQGGCLHPHHILNFAQWIGLRFAIDNGITFCKKCHREFHKKYGVKNNTREQVEEFLLDNI